jgi:hypothetical protein
MAVPFPPVLLFVLVVAVYVVFIVAPARSSHPQKLA